MWELTRITGIGNFLFKKREPDRFSHENPNPILKVWEGKWVGWN
jgi:hypothetical protein